MTPRMTMPAFRCLVLAWCVFTSAPPCFAQQYPPELQAVVDHILEVEYLELVDTTHYRLGVVNALTRDLDGDDRPEVVLHMTPHFRQSPTILVYRIAPDGSVTRVLQGLAPGPLVPLTGAFLDTHALRAGADFSVQEDNPDWTVVVRAALAQNLHVVLYSDFVHSDGRKGAGGFIDLSDRAKRSTSLNCSEFEFSRVAQIMVGSLPSASEDAVLAAIVGRELWLHVIDGFLPDGLMQLRQAVIEVPSDFIALALDDGGALQYRTSGGELRVLDVSASALRSIGYP